MEFITVEQFQEQPKEIQQVFLDWWKCNYGDLYYYNEDPLEYKDFEIINSNLECDLNGDFDYFKSIGVIPIFTEGQLRKFIEDRKGEIVEIRLCCGGYSIVTAYRKCEFDSLGKDLLQAYWKVACQIAREGYNG